MNKKEINEKIGIALGFKKYDCKINGKVVKDYAWEYPEQFRNLAHCTPCFYLPDFVQMIESVQKIYDISQSAKFSTSMF